MALVTYTFVVLQIREGVLDSLSQVPYKETVNAGVASASTTGAVLTFNANGSFAVTTALANTKYTGKSVAGQVPTCTANVPLGVAVNTVSPTANPFALTSATTVSLNPLVTVFAPFADTLTNLFILSFPFLPYGILVCALLGLFLLLNFITNYNLFLGFLQFLAFVIFSNF